MQESNFVESLSGDLSTVTDNDKPVKRCSVVGDHNNGDDDLVLDISGKSLDFSFPENVENATRGLYLYKNVFNLIPRSLGGVVESLKTMKFFANEINLFPEEFGNLVELECLQLKMSSPSLSNIPLHKLKDLKELELCKVPPRPMAFRMLREIAGLKFLTKLSVCHFSIRYLPPEIGYLSNLEYLDLSFNKLKSLPVEISYLDALISLKVANNKLVEIPSSLSSLQRLENLDLSNNRLTSLGSLSLSSMLSLQNLNLKYNKQLSCCQIPSWMCCNYDGNEEDLADEDANSSVEMDVFESAIEENEIEFSCSNNPLSLSIGSASTGKCYGGSKLGKRWKRHYYRQQRARQERLNTSRKWRKENHTRVDLSKEVVLDSESKARDESENVILGQDKGKLLCEKTDYKIIINNVDSEKEDSSDTIIDISISSKEEGNECSGDDELSTASNGAVELNVSFQSTIKAKRHSDKYLYNPKPCKFMRPIDNHSSDLSRKYSSESFCGIEDRLLDGFYDAGRDRPFIPLTNYEQILHRDSREVILLDRNKDEELDAIALSAEALISDLKRLTTQSKVGEEQDAVDNLQIISLLALFVSDHFGGSDRSGVVGRTRKAVSGSNYKKPFVCTCTTGNSESRSVSSANNVEDILLNDLSERSLRSIKARRNSVIVPLGTLQFGVCRHRALLMKYLCDRMEPQVPCELVRGYLDFLPHAWNVVPIKRGDSLIRMVVDACHPHDIREETDPEFFCRYIPLSRINISLPSQKTPAPSFSFPSLSTCDRLEESASCSLIRCKFGSLDAAAKVRTLEVSGTSVDEIKNFEYSCLGEVRILGALKHSCIVEIYGHQISSKWVPSCDGNPDRRVLQSAILFEYVKGGSLKKYIDMLSKAGEKRVPVELSLYIARDIACALAELHSKHIIHRDIKSENIVIDLDKKRHDGSPIVKLCDFDRAVPLRSYLHTCAIAHTGVHPPDACVGTPRWMAPEVLRTMHERKVYGLEVDIWSYGCLIFELLTLQVPYSGLPESNIHDLLQMGKRPQLTEELEASIESGTTINTSETNVEESLRFLRDIFRKCTKKNPADRPTADTIYKMVLAHLTIPKS